MRRFTEKKAKHLIDRIISNACANGNSEVAMGFTVPEGTMFVDGHRGYLFPASAPVPNGRSEGAEVMYERFLPYFTNAKKNCTHEIKAPDIMEVKAVARSIRHKGVPFVYDLGFCFPALNCTYLIDMLEMFPDARVFVNTSSPWAPVLFESEHGTGIILPVRTESKIHEWYHMRDQRETV